jgi:glycosyltransferase involved in cell wall biosynthesis
MAPFVWGGAEELAVHLQRNIELVGHQAEILRIPFQWEPASKIPSQMLMCNKFELINVDKVIALKFPAYIVRHPNKVIWLLHQYRQAYDLFDQGQTNIPPGNDGEEIRTIIWNGDNEAFSEAQRIFTNSEVTQGRLKHYNGFDSEVLLPPLNNPELFVGGGLGQYIFAGGRVNSMKRQRLLIEALAYTPRHVKLVIAGPPDSPSAADELRKLSEEPAVCDRLTLDLRFLPRAELAGYVNNALACAYVPFDEDSLGYISMEAANAGKALITTSDSGGVLRLVKHGVTGWVAEPDAKSLAAAMTDAANNRNDTMTRGHVAKELWNELAVAWPKTVEKLLT